MRASEEVEATESGVWFENGSDPSKRNPATQVIRAAILFLPANGLVELVLEVILVEQFL